MNTKRVTYIFASSFICLIFIGTLFLLLAAHGGDVVRPETLVSAAGRDEIRVATGTYASTICDAGISADVTATVFLPLMVKNYRAGILKEISYYPRDYAWEEFWRRWPAPKPAMDQDLDRIKALGFNTVRIFLPPSVLGYSQPSPAAIDNFEEVLALISAHGLKAHVNLFDCWQSWEDVSGSETWLKAIVGPHREDPRIAVWELRNEVGLNEAPIRNWVQALFPVLKQQAGNTPCTVSVSVADWLEDIKELTGSTPPDIYSLHWYPKDDVCWTRTFPTTIAYARQLIGQADLLIGEFGLSTYTFSDVSQADLYTDVLYYADQEGITNLGVWTLTDFPTGTAQCGGQLPNDPGEWYFGLYRTDGSPKPAVPILQAALQGNPPSNLSPNHMHNTSFEDRNTYSYQLDNWWPWDEQWTWQTWGVRDCTIAHSGQCSAKLNAPGTMAVGIYNIPALAIGAGQHYSLEGYVRTENLHGRAWIAISWFDCNCTYIRDTQSSFVTDPNLAQWAPIRLEHMVSPLNACYGRVLVQMYSSTPDSYVWFDDITILSE